MQQEPKFELTPQALRYLSRYSQPWQRQPREPQNDNKPLPKTEH